MDLLIVWEFRLGMIILCVSRVRLPAIVASCTFAVFAVQKVVILIDEGSGRLRLSWEFCSGGGAFLRRDFSHCIARKSGASSFVGLEAAKPQWFASMRTVGDSRLRRHFALSRGGFSKSGRLRRNVCGLWL